MSPSSRLTIRRPDDWHLHLRDGDMLATVIGDTARHFARAIVMPNLVPPVRTAEDALAYRRRIEAAMPAGSAFRPLMTLYLTEDSDPADIAAAHRDGVAVAVKLYPAGATTNSDSGVRDLGRVRPVLAAMEKAGMPLLIHGEVTDPEIDIFDREAVFIERHLTRLMAEHPGLRIVLEHCTTEEAVAFVEAAGGRLGATITPHHLVINRNALFQGGIRPHHYCLPIAKREKHRLALRRAAVSGNPAFFLGTDSAPHPIDAKEAACGCAGIYNAPTALATYAQVFAEEGALDRLEGFASLHGPAFYGLAPNEARLTLEAGPAEAVPDRALPEGGGLRVFTPPGGLHWRVAEAG
ncbi:MAG: dihydroorotase [Azospirillaceae bacterium]